MDKLEELNKAIKTIRDFCEGWDKDCDVNYCPFYINCAIKGNIEPPSYWHDAKEENEDE